MMYKIKEVARRYGVTVRTLQYYDDIGLLRVRRDERNARCYDDDDCLRLQCILMCRNIGMSLEAVANFMESRVSKDIIRDLLKKQRKECCTQLAQEEIKLNRLCSLMQNGDDVSLCGIHAEPYNVHKPRLCYINEHFTLARWLIFLFAMFDAVIVAGLVCSLIEALL